MVVETNIVFASVGFVVSGIVVVAATVVKNCATVEDAGAVVV